MRLAGPVVIAATALLLSPLNVPAASASWDTVITSGPADDSRLLPGDVTFAFSTGEGGSSFECSMNGAAFASCNSPMTYPDLPPGSYLFQVRGMVMGIKDDTPAQRSFVVRNVPCEEASADYAEAKSRYFKYHTRKGYKREALQRAKAAGQEAKVARLKQQIKALNKKIRAAKADMDAAMAQEDAVC